MTGNHASARIEPFGDAAVLVELTGADDEEAWTAAHALARTIQAESVRGAVDVVATYRHVFVEFDVAVTEFPAVRQRLVQLADRLDARSSPVRARRTFVLPTRYGGEHGPDLEPLAATLGLSPADLIDRHTRRPHRVRCLAGPVGGPMMDGPSLPAAVPRQASPRPSVPAGAVLLAGRQGFVKTMAGPGGWQIIGHTPVRFVDLDSDALVPWAPGDEISFEAIDEARWDELDGASVEVRHG